MSTEGSPCRILIVDDNEASAQTIGWMVELSGHDYRIATKASTALEIAREFVPELVLLDIGMPDVDGYTICRQMKGIPELKNAVFAAQTGWSQEEHRIKAKEAGFDHHLVKPVSLETLQKIIGQMKVA